MTDESKADAQFDAALRRNPRLQALRDEVQVALHNLSSDTAAGVLNALDDLADALDDAISSDKGLSKAEVEAQERSANEAKKPQ